MAVTKTHVVRLLEHLGAPFEVGAYGDDPEDLAAEMIARRVGLTLGGVDDPVSSP